MPEAGVGVVHVPYEHAPGLVIDDAAVLRDVAQAICTAGR
jgi:hypothetical protein